MENFTNSLTQIDFGGEPADQNPRQIDIGKAQKSSFLTIISSAYANEKALPIGSCAQDRARKSNAVKSLQDVVVTNYLWRPHLEAVLSLLTPGGVLIYETFMLGNAAYGKPSRPDFLLQPGELRAICARAGLRELAFFEGYADQPKLCVRQSIVAERFPRIGVKHGA